MRAIVWMFSLIMLFGVSLVAAQQPPAFEPAPCPEGIVATECGYVSVPEDHANPDGPTLRLAVAVTRAENAAPDPVFFLAGGPGEDGLVYSVLAQALPGYDIVVFDQRGAGISEPVLACSEYDDAITTSGAGSTDEVNAVLIDALIACGERLATELNLSVFNATQSAGDVESIRQALGYDQINLWGASYGTRLAEEVMRSYPDHLRAVILDSVIPPEVDRPADTARGVAGALDAVFAACAADATCDAAYPNLPSRYRALVSRLDAEPHIYTAPLGDGTTIDVPIGGSTVAAIMLGSMYTTAGVAQVPRLVDEFERGNFAILESAAASQFSTALVSAMTMGMFFATECQGEVAFSDPAAMSAAYDELPEWRGVLGSAAGLASERVYEICQDWGLMTPSGDENAPLVSDVPTLVMTGEFDPATPPAWVALAADGLSDHNAYIIPGQAHSPGLTSECGFGLALAFLADPTTEPDATCAASGSIDFALPDESLPPLIPPEATEAAGA